MLTGLWLVGCTPQSPDHYRAEFYALGTQIEILVRASSGSPTERDQAEAVFGVLTREFQRMHRDWHPWEPGPMADLNAGLQSGEWSVTTVELIELIEVSQRLESVSDGLFNPAMGKLVQLWGFHTSDYPITEPPPPAVEIDRLLAKSPSMHALEIDGLRVRSSHPDIRLDFSGLAKGLAVRLACERLAEHDFTDALVNAGGDVLVCGATDQAWRIAIRDPAGGVLQTVEVDQPLAVFTSGNYYRYGEWNGQRYAHILNPRSGQPVDEVLQATVIHADPLLADAAATTLIVAGSNHWQQTSKHMGIQQLIVVDVEGDVFDHTDLNLD